MKTFYVVENNEIIFYDSDIEQLKNTLIILGKTNLKIESTEKNIVVFEGKYYFEDEANKLLKKVENKGLIDDKIQNTQSIEEKERDFIEDRKNKVSDTVRDFFMQNYFNKIFNFNNTGNNSNFEEMTKEEHKQKIDEIIKLLYVQNYLKMRFKEDKSFVLETEGKKIVDDFLSKMK